ncbi:MAG: hypothetical protein OER85_15305 [Gammaproteobacteria bacterium]|nr:hypothetical protein [Gammaproteobacteria bacterium]
MSSQFSESSRSAGRTLTTAVMVFAILTLSAVPAAAQWRMTPSISAGLNYDDNIRLNTNSLLEESVSGWALEGDARISYDTQLAKFSLTPRLRLNRYDGKSELDSDDVFLDFDYIYTGQLSRFQFRGRYGDESVRTAERSNIDFQTDDPADIPADDSGRVFGTENRQRVLLAPSWSYQTGEKSTIRLGVRYLDVAYDETLLSTLRDFTESRGQASFEYESSERNTIGLSGYYRQNEFAGTAGDPTGYGLTLDFNRSLSEKTRFKLGAGFDSTEDSSGTDQSNPIGEISIIHKLQTSRVLASYQRSVQGSGSAEMSVRDSISLNLTRDLSERFSVGAGLRAYQTRALDSGATNFDERDYVQIGGLFIWKLTRAFSVDFDYRHTYSDRSTLASDASSNQATLWFRYRPIR